MNGMERVEGPSYDEIAEQIRRFTAISLRRYIEALEPYVLGLAGTLEPDARLGPTYLKALRELGDLYRVRSEPKLSAGVISVEQHEAELAAAVSSAAVAAAEQVRMEMVSELNARKFLDLDVARSQVSERMKALRSRVES